MQNKKMPGHALAALIILAISAFSIGWLTLIPTLLVMGLMGEGALLLVPVLMMVEFAWFAWLFFGLLTRQTWAHEWTQATAAVLCTVGALGLLAAAMSDLGLLLLVDSSVVLLGIGGYLLYAIGRADVREWLARPASPA